MAHIRPFVKRTVGLGRTPRAMQILSASTRLFFERGYSAVSIDEIGALVGVSGPAIYRHFRGKADILTALFDLTIDQLIEYAGPIRATPFEELDALLRAQAKLAVDHTELVRVFETEESALPEARRLEMRRRQRGHVKRWVTALSQVYPERSHADLEFLSYAAIGMMLSVPRWARSVRSHPELEELLAAAGQRVLGIPSLARTKNQRK